jgi:hypothetical protein
MIKYRYIFIINIPKALVQRDLDPDPGLYKIGTLLNSVILILQRHYFLCDILLWDIRTSTRCTYAQNIYKSLANFSIRTFGNKCVYEYL